MTATFREAQDDILTVFKAAWDTTGYSALYPGIPGEPPADQTGSGAPPSPWARVSVRHRSGRNEAFGQGGTNLYEREGVVEVQVFSPVGQGFGPALDLAQTVVSAFQGTATPKAVWFRKVGVREVPNSGGPWVQVNVSAEFTYDQRA